jgi:hypothetical protein
MLCRILTPPDGRELLSLSDLVERGLQLLCQQRRWRVVGWSHRRQKPINRAVIIEIA